MDTVPGSTTRSCISIEEYSSVYNASWYNCKGQVVGPKIFEIYVQTVTGNYQKNFNKVKPKSQIRIKIYLTNFHGSSMEVQDIFKLDESIENERKEAQNQKKITQ